MSTLQAIANRLDLLPVQAHAELVQVEDAVRADLVRELAAYPPERPNQRYVRTYDLRRGWTDTIPLVVDAPLVREATLHNPVPYVALVQGPDDQADIHADRWATTEAIVDHTERQRQQHADDAAARLVAFVEGA